MTPPKARADRQTAEAPDAPSAVSVCPPAGGSAPDVRAPEVQGAGDLGTRDLGPEALAPPDMAPPDMAPPSLASGTLAATETPAAAPRRRGPVPVIPQRADFLKAASARRQGTPSFLLQARDRRDGSPVMRMGFTASKKTGNSVTRNRARRRLREAARAILPDLGRPGWDYVLVARPGGTVTRVYADLLTDLRAALDSVHRPPRAKAPPTAAPPAPAPPTAAPPAAPAAQAGR